MVIKINSFEQFKTLTNDGYCLVDCYADWCGPCKMLAPIIEEISEEVSDKIKFYKVNIDEVMSVADTYRIQSIPTLLIFKSGELVDRIIGYRSKIEILQHLK